MLILTISFSPAYFTSIVKVTFNLLYYQIVLQLCTHLTEDECDRLVEDYSSASPTVIREKGVPHIGPAMAFVLANLDRCRHIRSDSVLMTDHSAMDGGGASTPNGSSDPSPRPKLDLDVLEKRLQRLCLPFLRVAALLRHHIYHSEIPEIPGPHWEFSRLVYYLELVTVSMDLDKFNAAKALCFLPGTELALPKFWCDQLREIRPTYESTRSLIVAQHVEWQQPKLLGLPREYERLFTVGFVGSMFGNVTGNNWRFSLFFAVLPRAAVPQVSERAEGELDLSAVRYDRVPQAGLLQGSGVLRGREGKFAGRLECVEFDRI